MRPSENYSPFIAVAFVLTIAILASFQIYILREPARIAADEADQKNVLFSTNCSVCHGKQGEGDVGPALNDKPFLASTDNDTIFSVISSGVPGTEMPAWNQVHGGPLTDQEVRQIVTYVRNWEPNAPNTQAVVSAGDPAQGLKIYDSTCIVCHGKAGMGINRAPALNDPVKLAQFDDKWYSDTITDGRPAQGMPTWGTVLSPE